MDDPVGLNTNKVFRKAVLDQYDEELIFSCRLKKVNRKGSAQDRVLAITEGALYNLDGKKPGVPKRRIPFQKLRQIVRTSDSENDFHVCVTGEYDYHFRSTLRSTIIAKVLDFNSALRVLDVKTADVPANIVTKKEMKKAKGKPPKLDKLVMQQASNGGIPTLLSTTSPSDKFSQSELFSVFNNSSSKVWDDLSENAKLVWSLFSEVVTQRRTNKVKSSVLNEIVHIANAAGIDSAASNLTDDLVLRAGCWIFMSRTAMAAVINVIGNVKMLQLFMSLSALAEVGSSENRAWCNKAQWKILPVMQSLGLFAKKFQAELPHAWLTGLSLGVNEDAGLLNLRNENQADLIDDRESIDSRNSLGPNRSNRTMKEGKGMMATCKASNIDDAILVPTKSLRRAFSYTLIAKVAETTMGETVYTGSEGFGLSELVSLFDILLDRVKSPTINVSSYMEHARSRGQSVAATIMKRIHASSSVSSPQATTPISPRAAKHKVTLAPAPTLQQSGTTSGKDEKGGSLGKEDIASAIATYGQHVKFTEFWPMLMGVITILKDDDLRLLGMKAMASLLVNNMTNIRKLLRVKQWERMLWMLFCKFPAVQDSSQWNEVSLGTFRYAMLFLAIPHSFPYFRSMATNLEPFAHRISRTMFSLAVHTGWNEGSVEIARSLLNTILMQIASWSAGNCSWKLDADSDEWRQVVKLAEIVHTFMFYRTATANESKTTKRVVSKKANDGGIQHTNRRSSPGAKKKNSLNEPFRSTYSCLWDQAPFKPMLAILSPATMQRNRARFRYMLQAPMSKESRAPGAGIHVSADRKCLDMDLAKHMYQLLEVMGLGTGYSGPSHATETKLGRERLEVGRRWAYFFSRTIKLFEKLNSDGEMSSAQPAPNLEDWYSTCMRHTVNFLRAEHKRIAPSNASFIGGGSNKVKVALVDPDLISAANTNVTTGLAKTLGRPEGKKATVITIGGNERVASNIRVPSAPPGSPSHGLQEHEVPAAPPVPECAICQQGCFDDLVEFDDVFFHESCFSCTQCSKSLDGSEPHARSIAKKHQLLCGLTCRNAYLKAQSRKSAMDEALLVPCADCFESFEPSSKVAVACSKYWHLDHFSCTSCRDVLDVNGEFFEFEGWPYCNSCYTENYMSCFKCGETLADSDDAINALGHTWHKEHFGCSVCGEAFGNSEYFMATEDSGENVAYCKRHYTEVVAKRCETCEQPLSGAASAGIQIGDSYYHPIPDCFRCTECQVGLDIDSATSVHTHMDHPYCERCYTEQHGELCSHCNKLITENVLHTQLADAGLADAGLADAGGDVMKWHASCFKCLECDKPLHNEDFVVISDPDQENAMIPFCREHYESSIAQKLCPGCPSGGVGTKAGLEMLEYAGKSWHPSCLRCQALDLHGDRCETLLWKEDDGRILVSATRNAEGELFCDEHFKSVGIGMCTVCNEPVIDPETSITAMDKLYHPTCFTCSTCSRVILEDEGFAVAGGSEDVVCVDCAK